MTKPAAAAATSDADHPYTLVRHTTGRPAYVSGVLPYLPDGSVASGRDASIAAVLATLERRLAVEGAGLSDVAKATVYLTDISWLPALNAAWAAAFAEPRPARAAIEVRALPRQAQIEVEATLDLTG